MQRQTSHREFDRRSLHLAAQQYGVVSHAQLLEAGLTKQRIRTRLASGDLEPVHRGVYRLGGAPSTWHQAVMAACLASGREAAASHGCAARLFGLAGFDRADVEVRVPRGRRVRLGFGVHEMDLPRTDRTQIGVIPVTTPARTLIDVASSETTRTVAIGFDDALRKRIVTPERMWRAVERHRGTAGVALIRELLRSRALVGVPDTPIETLFLEAIREEGLPLPIAQYEIRHRGRLIARPDFAYPSLHIAIELDSATYHSLPADIRRDARRNNGLMLLDWFPLHFTWDRLEEEPREVAAEVAEALEAARRGMFRAATSR